MLSISVSMLLKYDVAWVRSMTDAKKTLLFAYTQVRTPDHCCWACGKQRISAMPVIPTNKFVVHTIGATSDLEKTWPYYLYIPSRAKMELGWTIHARLGYGLRPTCSTSSNSSPPLWKRITRHGATSDFGGGTNNMWTLIGSHRYWTHYASIPRSH